jgi:hypothetical protein
VLVAVGDRPAVGDSVEAQGGSVEIYASDANGIETLLVDREVIGLESASGMPAAVGLHDGAVMGRVQVSPPFGGQMLETVVRDRAGVVTRRDFTAFGPPDVQAPVVQETEAADDAFAFSAVVDDFSGIATASVDACPAPIRYLSSVQSEGRSERARAITGWGDFQGPAGLRVTDRSGNVARAQVPVFTPVVEARGEPPAFDAVSAIATGAPQTVHFKAWVGGSAGDRLTLTARTADGRVHSEALDVQSGDEPTPSGRLEVVLLGSAAERAEVARDRLRASEEIIGPARVSAYAAQNTIEAGLMDLGTRVRPDSRVWVHIEGVLGGAPNELAPRVEFADGSSLSVAGLTLRIRSLKAQAVLVTARILPGRSWQVPLGNVPGAQPAPGCFDPDGSVPGSVAALPGVPMERILEALTGAGDRDGDGRITVLEVLDWAGAGVPEGPVTFRPDAPLTTTGNKR